jgi:hypothetical protein
MWNGSHGKYGAGEPADRDPRAAAAERELARGECSYSAYMWPATLLRPVPFRHVRRLGHRHEDKLAALSGAAELHGIEPFRRWG